MCMRQGWSDGARTPGSRRARRPARSRRRSFAWTRMRSRPCAGHQQGHAQIMQMQAQQPPRQVPQEVLCLHEDAQQALRSRMGEAMRKACMGRHSAACGQRHPNRPGRVSRTSQVHPSSVSCTGARSTSSHVTCLPPPLRSCTGRHSAASGICQPSVPSPRQVQVKSSEPHCQGAPISCSPARAPGPHPATAQPRH